MQDNNNYHTPFHSVRPSFELQQLLAKLQAAQHGRRERIKELLGQARTDQQVARLFHADRRKQTHENVRHWCEQSVVWALKALLWATIGLQPANVSADRYRDLLKHAAFDVSMLPNPRWSAPCDNDCEAQQRLNDASLLLQMVEQAIDRKLSLEA